MAEAIIRETATAGRTVDLMIVGGGFSGIAMALAARRLGFADLVILEKAADFGGTWRENTYPGVACDIPSHLYALAGHPNPGWRRRYAGGAEIWDYLRAVARREGLCPLARFGCTVTAAAWDGAARRWRVETSDGARWSARVLVSATGPLHVPRLPDLPGLGDFRGPAFHSAVWDHGARLAGRNVAVVGTGASAGQLVPRLAREARRLTVYQRSPAWVLPHFDFALPGWMRRLYAALPWLCRADRAVSFNMQELKHAVFRGDPLAAGLVRRIASWQLRRVVRDPALRRLLTPDYRIGCKRILLSNDWYPALTRPNVELVAAAVTGVTPDGVVAADGTTRPAEVLVFATGFGSIDATAALPYRGRDGRSLAEAWDGRAEAYLGTAVAGFPNLFLMLGPNTALGHNSVLLMAEAQAKHVARLMAAMRDAGIEAIEPRAALQAAHVAGVRRRLEAMVWQTGGCSAWYKDAEGRNPTIWPGTVREFRGLLRNSGLGDYQPAPGCGPS